MRIARDGSCVVHCCTQNGHTVCEKVADWIGDLTDVSQSILRHPGVTLPAEIRVKLENILAQDPDMTSS